MICEVIVDIANSFVDKIFDYEIDDENSFKIGQRVLVPFSNRQVEGYILKFKDKSELDSSKLKKVIKGLDDFSYFNTETIFLMDYLIKTYNLRYADCIRLFVPNVVRKNVKEKTIKIVKFNENNAKNCKKFNENQAKIVEFLSKNPVFKLSELLCMFSSSSIKTLIKNEVLSVESVVENRMPYIVKSEKKEIKLNEEQQNAVDKIISSFGKTFLLFGVTASGKTEVYIKVIENALKNNKSAILLVPEIGLTPQLFSRFTSVFGKNVAIIHSGLSCGEKLDQWLKIKRGEAKVVIGARSAIFAPVENLGVVILDEEHDTSYYSETNPRYYAKDVANIRAKFCGANLILGSATPSVDSFSKAKAGIYELVQLKNRAVSKKLPEIYVVDMMHELRIGNASPFSKFLQAKLVECLSSNHQALIFLNRRGYTSFLRCLDCGYCPKCEDCDVSLVYHKEDEQLKCHYCGNRYKVLTKCPNCGGTNLRKGAIGTQLVVEKLQKMFPDVKIFRLDNDAVSTKDSHTKILEEFNKTSPAILVGTQMISKGHNFMGVNLVGIIDADLSLHYADFRSSERTFDLLTQVAGRAGRQNDDGEVVLQTYMPRHYVYGCICQNDYEKLYEKEINLRKITNFPPFSKIVRVLIASENDDDAKNLTGEVYKKILDLKQQNSSSFFYLGAMKSPVKRAKRQFRYQILMRLKLDDYDKIIEKIFKINRENSKKNVTSFVEIDPQNLS